MTKKKTIIYYMIKMVQILLYIPIQIAFIPLIIIGMSIGAYKEFVVGKRLGVSYSAGQTLQYRFYMHYFNTRKDSLTVSFVKHFPCESHFGLWSMFGAFFVSKRLFGLSTKLDELPNEGEETLGTTAAVRVLTFDRIIEKYIDKVDQIVIPGVGFDLIALKYTKDKNVKVFEMDQTNSMNVKVETLKEAGIEHEWINYVPVDYINESWSEKLLEAGFDKSKSSLFIWQSVSHFLDEELVKDTLRTMADLMTDDSVISLDLYSKNFISGSTSFSVKQQKNMMAKMNEPWIFGLDMSKNPEEVIQDFLSKCGLEIIMHKQFGEKLDIEPFYSIVNAKKV